MKLNNNHALVVLSGGQDSTTCLGIALNNYEKVSAITFNYGQRHAIELDAAQRVRMFFEQQTGRRINHEVVDVRGTLISTSPLTSDEPLEQYTGFDSMSEIIGDRQELTFVPMRNSLFLTIAANRAVSIGARYIYTGICEDDGSNYDDCTGIFARKIASSINESLGLAETGSASLVLVTPLLHRSKAQSIHLAMEIPFTYEALAFSHTAYDGKYPPTGKDHASVLRAHGFEEAGLPDPLVIRAVEEGLMPLPTTANYAGNRVIE